MAKTSGGTRGGKGGSLNIQEKVVAGIESTIRNNEFESRAIIDAKGNILSYDRGDKKQVGNTLADIYNMRDNVVTHNHPAEFGGNYKVGGSLSADDITLAVFANAKEMRAVSGQYIYSLKRPKVGWGASESSVKKAIKKIDKKLQAEASSYISKYKGKTGTAVARVGVLINHQRNKELAKLFGWDYSRTKVKN